MISGYYWRSPPDPAAMAILVMPASGDYFDRPVPELGKARFAGLLNRQRTVVDEVVVSRLAAGVVEVSCHGGSGVRQAVDQALAGHGLQCLGQDPQPEGSAWHVLSDLVHPQAVVEALADPQGVCQAGWWPFARRVPQILICGPANAGKSTLLNAWAGQQRAIASDQAGTTRDLLTVEITVGGWRLALTDSAGLRETSDEVEAAGQQLVTAARRQADVVIECIPADGDLSVVEAYPPSQTPPVLTLLTKADLAHRALPGLSWMDARFGDAIQSRYLLSQLEAAVLDCLLLSRR